MRGISRSEVLVALVAATAVAIVVTGQEAEPLSVTPVKDGLYYITAVPLSAYGKRAWNPLCWYDWNCQKANQHRRNQARGSQ
jgi:hypothetical protein